MYYTPYTYNIAKKGAGFVGAGFVSASYVSQVGSQIREESAWSRQCSVDDLEARRPGSLWRCLAEAGEGWTGSWRCAE